MRRQLLVISNMYPSAADRSHGLFVERCVHGLRAAGVDVTTAVLASPPGRWRRLLAYLRFAWQANRSVLAGGYDGVWIHQPLHSLLAALPALWLSRAPVVLNFHGHDLVPVTRRGRLLRRLLQRHFAAADRVLVPSQRFKQLFDAEFGQAQCKGAQVFASGGVDARHFAAAPPLAARPCAVLFLSRWVAGKGWPLFIELASKLAASDTAMHFTLAGVGPDAAAIHAAVAAAGLHGRLRTVTSDTVEHNAELYRSHRYLVLPSDFDESLALVNLEAMASGCVVLSRDFAAAREYIQHGHNGFRFGTDAFVAACAATIAALEADPPHAQRLADEGRESAWAYAEPAVMAALPGLLGLDTGPDRPAERSR